MELTNKNDYRYLAAMQDLKAYGLDTPPMLYEDTPRYIGLADDFPETASIGQWIVWAGSTDNSMIVGDIYMWNGTNWVHKAPDDAASQGMYMQSLSDILRVAPGEVGRFSAVITNLLMAQEIVVGKVLKTANFNGTIDANGQITNAGTEGVAITKAGKSVVTDGIFRGQLDCDVMKVYKQDIYQLKAHYAKEASAWLDYLQSISPYDGSELDTTTTALFGANNYIVLDDGARYSGRVKVKYFVSRTSDCYMKIYPNGSEVVVGKLSGGGVYDEYHLYFDYKQTYELSGASNLEFTSSLPTSDPHVAGRAWQSGGYLRISLG